MVFRIQRKFRRGSGVDQEDVFRVTPDGAGDFTSESSRHSALPFPPIPSIPPGPCKLRRSFDPVWKSRQSGPPYPNRRTIRAEAPMLFLPGNREARLFPPELAVGACCSSSSLPRRPALGL